MSGESRCSAPTLTAVRQAFYGAGGVFSIDAEAG
jgi:hypothetical protein